MEGRRREDEGDRGSGRLPSRPNQRRWREQGRRWRRVNDGAAGKFKAAANFLWEAEMEEDERYLEEGDIVGFLWFWNSKWRWLGECRAALNRHGNEQSRRRWTVWREEEWNTGEEREREIVWYEFGIPWFYARKWREKRGIGVSDFEISNGRLLFWHLLLRLREKQ